MTAIEVLDTFVKIGLGALVGGWFTLAVQKRNHQHEERGELLRRRRDNLDEICKEFEAVHAVVSTFINRAGAIAAGTPQGPVILRAMLNAPNEDVDTQRTKATARLHYLEGRLYLLGFKNISVLVAEYRQIVARIGAATDSTQWDQAFKAITELLMQLEQQRVNIYESLNKKFEDKN